MSTLEITSPCKLNLLLNILGRRPDGFHELETIMQPVALHDHLAFATAARGIALTCSRADLPAGPENLVWRAAELFLKTAGIPDGIKIHLEKHIPLAAGLGGGSGNGALTLRGLNELFGRPLTEETLYGLAAQLGSDLPFFLQDRPALATGRGEMIQPLSEFAALTGAYAFLVHPGFGVSTAWAYKNLANYPAALNGQSGRAQALVQALQTRDLRAAGAGFYNSLEAPVLPKYPLLQLFQDALREFGADAAMMSGSGSTTFAVMASQARAEQVREEFAARFGGVYWTALLPLAVTRQG